VFTEAERREPPESSDLPLGKRILRRGLGKGAKKGGKNRVRWQGGWIRDNADPPGGQKELRKGSFQYGDTQSGRSGEGVQGVMEGRERNEDLKTTQ